jgi:hypothetical protein
MRISLRLQASVCRRPGTHFTHYTNRIMSEVLAWRTSNKANALINKYKEQGWISDDDMIELLREHMQGMYEFGRGVITAGYSPVY